MTENGMWQVAIYLLVLLALVQPLGWYMARVYEGKRCGLDFVLGPFERLIYKLSGVHTDREMGWKKYLSAMLVFNLLGMLFLYALQRLQFYLPLNPQSFSAVTPALSFNTAGSFITNSDWQAYGGENSLSYLTQSLGLTVQNFLSAATGMSLLMALIRGIARHETAKLGNFWVDTVRGILYILLPLSLILALGLSSQGVIQNYKPYVTAGFVKEQVIPMGPVASQVAIKQLGTNGGGFFNTNSAHPFENPNIVTNFLEMLAILLIPAALCYTFGVMVKDRRQGWAILLAMYLMFIPVTVMTITAEQYGNPALTKMGVEAKPQHNMSTGGNMEGKEVRFGIVNSALWSTATTGTSNGSVNAMHDSFTPIGGMMPLWLMHLGEVVFGGVGCGLYGMLMLVIIAVFVAGLMVGRTPEYLGKKIEPYEMKMASVAVLLMPLMALLLSAIGSVTHLGIDSLANPGAHGFSEILYAFTSMGNNNGSAFAGLNANTPLYNIAGGLEMVMLRFWMAIPVLAIAGSLARKKIIPGTVGTLSTHTFLFIILLIAVTLIIAALSFFPALALGPIVEQLMLWGQYGH